MRIHFLQSWSGRLTLLGLRTKLLRGPSLVSVRLQSSICTSANLPRQDLGSTCGKTLAKLEDGRGFLYRLAHFSAATKSSANDLTSLSIFNHPNYPPRYRRVDPTRRIKLHSKEHAMKTSRDETADDGTIMSHAVRKYASQPLLLVGVTRYRDDAGCFLLVQGHALKPC
jgi:hypothetical protein